MHGPTSAATQTSWRGQGPSSALLGGGEGGFDEVAPIPPVHDTRDRHEVLGCVLQVASIAPMRDMDRISARCTRGTDFGVFGGDCPRYEVAHSFRRALRFCLLYEYEDLYKHSLNLVLGLASSSSRSI